MIALDTNVIVRFLTRDDEKQFRKAELLLSRYRVLVTPTVLLETEWVLSHAYHFGRDDIASSLARLKGLPNVVFLEPEACEQAMGWHRLGMDFADALHVPCAQSADSFATFDQRLIKKANQVSSSLAVIPV